MGREEVNEIYYLSSKISIIHWKAKRKSGWPKCSLLQGPGDSSIDEVLAAKLNDQSPDPQNSGKALCVCVPSHLSPQDTRSRLESPEPAI